MKPKHQPLPPCISKSFNDGDAEDYEKEERKARGIIGPALSGRDLAVAEERVPLTPVESISRAPHVDHLMADLYTVLLLESAELRKLRSTPGAQSMDPAEMMKLTKLIDGVKQLTKLQLERERQDRPEELNKEEMIAALREQLEHLETE